MKAKRNWIVTIVLLVIFLAVMQVTHVAGKSKQPNETTPQIKYVTKQREILAGLNGVYVLVEHFKPEAEKYGFKKELFKTDVELRLRQYGVKVFSSEELLQAVGKPKLYINVNPLINEKYRDTVANVSVEFREEVFLLRNPTITIITNAITWRRTMLSTGGLNRLNEVRDCVRDLVDIFINDYLAANPKVTGAKSKSD